MRKIITLCLISMLALSVYSDIFNCVDKLVISVPTIEKILKDYKNKNFDLVDLMHLGNDIVNIQNTCEKPFCLQDALDRCLKDNPDLGCEQNGLIIYPKCRAGYHNFGCCICNQDCPSGFRDDGAYCAKPSSYGRGAGYPWKFGDKPFDYNGAKRRCEKDHGQGRCEQNGLIYYPKCAENFHNVGCCVCSPNCPSSMTDIGVSCQKRSYGRGVGYPFEFGDCQNMGHIFPFVVNGECDQKLEQIQAPLEQILKLIAEKQYSRAVLVFGRSKEMIDNYLETCRNHKQTL